jgi:GntR family transcriptional regulator/MocR family aminotransferase
VLLLNLREGSGPLYRRVYQELKSAIQAGRLRPGARLPSSRGLADDLGISRNTVLLAYEQLGAEGYVTTQGRSVTLVANTVPSRSVQFASAALGDEEPRLSCAARHLTRDPAVPPSASYATRPGIRYDFRYGLPAVREFPRETWRRLLAARARGNTRDAYGYASPAGYAPLRHVLSDYLRRARGLFCEADQIVIVNGSQQGFDLAARVLLDRGDGAIVEEPHYPGSRIALESAGARIVRIAVDQDGLDTSRLPGADAGVRLACVSPCHQFPSGVVMSLERRLALLDWAARANAWIVEDDYIGEMRYEGHPLEALQSLDQHGRVIYAGTFSKTLFPALRLAYLVLPHALVRPFQAMKWVSDRFAEVLTQQALTDFIASGQFERHLRRSTARNAARRSTLIKSLQQLCGDRIEISGRDAGVHLQVWLNGVAPGEVGAIIERAAQAGVGLYSTLPYYARTPKRAGLLFGYAALTEAEIRAGIRKLANIL